METAEEIGNKEVKGASSLDKKWDSGMKEKEMRAAWVQKFLSSLNKDFLRRINQIP